MERGGDGRDKVVSEGKECVCGVGVGVSSEGGRETLLGICEWVWREKMRVAEMSEFIASGEYVGEDESDEGRMKRTVMRDSEVC